MSAVASRRGDLADEFEDLLHRFATAHNAQFVILGFQQRLVGNDLFHVARGLERVGHNLLKLQHIKRLEQVVVGAELHRFDGRLGRAVGGHQDDEEFGVARTDAAKRLQSVQASHAHVHQHKVGLEFGNNFQPFLAARSRAQFDFRRDENPLE